MPYPYSQGGDYIMDQDCPDEDVLCTYALKCYECDSSYALEEGFCLSRQQCRKYSRYNSTALSFNPAYCKCADSYFLTGVTSCSRCHIDCLTCGSTVQSGCLSCPEGADLSSPSGGSCSYNDTYTPI